MFMKNMFIKLAKIAVVFFGILNTGCEDFLDINSSTATDDTIVLSNTSNLDKILVGTYNGLLMGNTVYASDRGLAGLTGMMHYYPLAGTDITSLKGMGTSEHTAYTFADSRTQASGFYTQSIWSQFYDHINRCNIILDALTSATGPDSDKKEISGQAKAIRAISYFNLIMNYQKTYAVGKSLRGVILRTSSSDPDSMPFSTVEDIYNRIVTDLNDAKIELRDYQTSEPWRIDYEVVCSWLARVYLVMATDWSEVFNNANAAYENHKTLLTKEQWCGGFDDFIENQYNEFIWGYQNTELSNAGTSTPFNMWFNLPPSAGESNNTQYIYSYITYFVTDQWLKLFDGDETDYRASRLDKTEDVKDEDILDVSNDYAKYMLWHRTNNPDKMTKSKWAYNKFLHLGEQGETRADICLIRSSEMLLMMAEAAVHLDKIPEALNYLQTLQSARNVSKITTTTDKDELLEAIYIERRKELLGETVTGMFDNLRLQKDVIREGESLENNYAGHFNEGLLYWGSKAGSIATLKANDYRYFCQIPDIEFTRNKAISQDEQNPISGN